MIYHEEKSAGSIMPFLVIFLMMVAMITALFVVDDRRERITVRVFVPQSQQSIQQ